MSLFRRRSLITALAVAVLFAAASSDAAQPSLVADLAPPGDEPQRALPRLLASTESVAFFVPLTSFNTWGEPELWRSDGTAAGTSILFDVCPDLCLDPEVVGELDGNLFLSADLEGLSFEPPFDASLPPTWLVRTDGTTAGTVVLDGPFWVLRGLGNAGGRALFAFVRSSEVGVEQGILAADRTGDAPALILPVPLGVWSSVESGGLVFFTTFDALWRSDGTAAGTHQIDARSCSTLAAVSDGVVCWDTDGVLLASDGGALRPLARGRPITRRRAAEDGEGRVFYLLDDPDGGPDGLWVTDGTASGTRRLPAPAELGDLAAHDGRAFFAAADAAGSEPWTSDGTPLGTRPRADLCPGPCSSSPRGFAPHAGGVLFTAVAVPEGTPSLWHVGFVPSPPRRLVDGPFGTPRLLRHQGDVYVAWDHRLRRIDAGLEVHDLGAADAMPIAAAGPWVLFSRGAVLWRTDGTAAGSAPVAAVEAPPGSDPQSLLELDGRLCFLASHAPWCAGPGGIGKLAWDDRLADRLTTAGGRLLVGGFHFLAAYPDLAEPPVELLHFAPHLPLSTQHDGLLYWLSTSALWRSDGTVEGTRRVADGVGHPLAPPIALGGRLLFVTNPPGHELLWSSDGTPEGTVLLYDEPTVFRSLRPERFGGAVWFVSGDRLWRTDGTPAGTISVFDVAAFRGGPGLHALPDRLLLVGTTADGAHRLIWSTDGETPPQEVELPPLWTGVQVGERWFFVDRDERDELQLWVSDGTLAASRVLELPDGARSTGRTEMTALDGHLLFLATDLAHGTELWISDGSDEGTRRLFDLAPGPASSSPEHPTRVGDLLYFAADDGRTGRELWSVPWDQVTGEGSCQPAETRLCLGGGRFAVTVHWRDQINGGEGSGRAVPLPGSEDSGTFWFFDPGNVELIVKALDGTPVNGHHWLFYGALSTVEYRIDVLDTVTGKSRRYHNPPGEQCGRGDTAAFAGGPAAGASRRGAGAVAAPATSCGSGALCLLGGSLAVEVSWHDPRSGDRGAGVPIPGTDQSGFFWFFDDENVELVVKALDGTTVNGHRWFFYGGLSDVEYEIRVTETATGTERVYRNPFGEICGGADTAAF